MAVVVTHGKTNNIADWTQADLDAQIALGNFPPGTLLADIVLPSDWNDGHSITGLATVAETGDYDDLSNKPDLSTFVPYTGAASDVDLGSQKIITDTAQAKTSAGLSLKTNGGSDWLHGGNGGSPNATMYGGWNYDNATASTLAYYGSSKTFSSVTLSGLTLTTGTLSVDAASTSAAGKIEIADLSEVNTGTDTSRAVVPDTLAGSYAGTASVIIEVFAPTANVDTGDGKSYITIPEKCNGMNLVRATATVVTAGTTNATTIQIYNVTQAADMLSGLISIASGGTVATAGTIDTANDDVATNDVLRIDVDTVSTTKPQGLTVVLEFRLA